MGNWIAATITLAACIALVMVAFPRLTPPDNNNAVAPLVNANNPTSTPVPNVITVTPMADGVSSTVPTATPLPGQASFENDVLDGMPTPTPVAFDISMLTATAVPFGGANPIISLSSERFFGLAGESNQVLSIETGFSLALYLPVVTVTDLPGADLGALLAANVVELVPVGTGRVIGVQNDGRVEILMHAPRSMMGSAWATQDSKALIVFTVIGQ